MMDVFLLVPQEVVGDVVKTVGGELMLSMHVDKQIQLNSPLDIYVLRLSVPHYL